MLQLNHKKLDVWKISIDFVANIYRVTSLFPTIELYGLNAQLRRASISVSSNIAEGAARKSLVERKRFFEIARSSLVEVDTQLEISKRLSYMKQEDIDDMEKILNKLFAKLSNLIKNAR